MLGIPRAMTGHIDVPADAWQIRPGDRLVPTVGTVRIVTTVDHRDRSLITVDGFDAPELWDLDPQETVTLRCPTESRAGWEYRAGPQPGSVLHCSCVYRRVETDSTWAHAICVPGCAWCSPDNEED